MAAYVADLKEFELTHCSVISRSDDYDSFYTEASRKSAKCYTLYLAAGMRSDLLITSVLARIEGCMQLII